jgi:hypothetical protein
MGKTYEKSWCSTLHTSQHPQNDMEKLVQYEYVFQKSLKKVILYMEFKLRTSENYLKSLKNLGKYDTYLLKQQIFIK